MRHAVPILVALTLGLAACATDDATLPSDARAVNTGVFPTFTVVPAAANRQLPQGEVDRTVRRLEGAEAAALAEPQPMMVEERIAQLDAAGRRARAGAPVPADQRARLAQLGRTHSADTIARIEAR